MSEYKLRLVTDSDTIDQIFRFRAKVWTGINGVAADAFPSGRWQDQHDANAHHWIVTNSENRIVGSARLNLHEQIEDVVEAEQYQRYSVQCDGLIAAPDRVVVCASARRQGIAQRLLDAQHDASVRAGVSCALRQASPSMCRLISKRDWQLLGPATIDPRFPETAFTVAVRVYLPAQVRFQACSDKAVA